ncbi:MAG: hypothetical protein ABIC04_05645 [Nanoarchaeota archaeon]
MKKIIEKAFMLGLGTVSLTTKAAEKILKDIAKKSKISKSDSEKLAKSMLKQANKQANKIQKFIEKEANKQLKKVKPMVKKAKKKVISKIKKKR